MMNSPPRKVHHRQQIQSEGEHGDTDGLVQSPSKISGKLWTAGLFVLALVAVGLFLYWDRHNRISTLLRSLGLAGVLVAIVIKTLITVTPIPNEALLILYMKIYGAWWGALYAWIGGALSSFLMFAIAKHYGRPLLTKLISSRRFEAIDQRIRKHGSLGILFVRLLPIPGYITSYVVGTMPSVKLWTYIWTEAISVIPYYLGSVLLFMGVMHNVRIWIAVGGVVIVVVWVAGYLVQRASKRSA